MPINAVRRRRNSPDWKSQRPRLRPKNMPINAVRRRRNSPDWKSHRRHQDQS